MLFKPQFVPVVTTMLTPFAQHGGVRYDNTSYTAYQSRCAECGLRPMLHTADSCPTFSNVTNRRTDRHTVSGLYSVV